MSGESPPPQRILLVTGLLGAGKTTALNVLEDLGWETIDNFPAKARLRLARARRSSTGGSSFSSSGAGASTCRACP